jgi:hypothetical protein
VGAAYLPLAALLSRASAREMKSQNGKNPAMERKSAAVVVAAMKILRRSIQSLMAY